MKISVQGLYFNYSSRPVLKGLEFGIREGELVGIIGSNGSGKSTLLKCLNRILSPQRGMIMVSDEDASRMSIRQISRLIGYVPQSIPDSFAATVFDTVLMGRKPHVSFSPSREDLDLVLCLLKEFGIEDLAMDSVDMLSGGQRQKVFIARALAQQPQIILLDEPTANLDLKHQIEAMEIIRDVTYKGVSVVIAIHDINLAARYCDSFIMLKEGTIYDAGSKDILTQRSIREVYDIDTEIISYRSHMMVVPTIRDTSGNRGD